MIGSLHRGLSAAGKRQDLVVVVLLVTAILMMILPLPTWLVDMLIAVNIAGAVLLLMMGLYLKSPLDFSTLPSVILIITIFRLALSITTTRLILLNADAGSIIETFGQFVIAGEIIVGLVVFLIITIVQFVVITKGSERVAEVSARFTLDALPGKQMSIDSDLRNGDIEQSEARSRRRTIEQESQFFGAMDGAMKFVKGDAIAGLVIVAVNLIGGIAIGMVSHNMAAGQAVETYSLLTVGDGLAAQLPALFVSLAAGAVITRVATDANENLGADITREMISSTIALRVAAVILFVMMFIPGFPWFVFLFLSLGLMTISFSERLNVLMFGEQERDETESESDLLDTVGLEKSPFVVRINPELMDADARTAFADESREAALGIGAEIGLAILPPRLSDDPSLPLDTVRIDLDDVVVAGFVIDPERLAIDADADTLTIADVAFEVANNPPSGFENLHWIDPAGARVLSERGFEVLTPVEAMLIGTRTAQLRFASQCIGVQEARSALVGMAQHYPDLASEVRDLLPLNKIAEVFRRLVAEGVPIRNQRLLLEALTEWSAKEQDPVVLTEYVRTALKRQICNSLAGEDRVIPVYLLDSAVEDVLRNSVRQTTVGEYLALDDNVSAALVETIRDNLRAPAEGGTPPVVLASLDVRRFVRSLMSNNGMRDTAVLSYQDLSTEFTITPLTTIYMPEQSFPTAAE